MSAVNITLGVTHVLVAADDSVRMPQVNYGQCGHERLVKNGFEPTAKRGKVQRFKCAFCGATFVEGSRALLDRRAEIGRALAQGFSVREVAHRLGASREGVRFVKRIMAGRLPERCPCGKPAGHSGPRLRNCSMV